MRRMFVLLTLIAVTASLAWAKRDQWLATADPGYVVVGYGHWAIEFTLLLAIIALGTGFILSYILVRIVLNTLSLPRILRKRGGDARNRRSQRALLDGLIETAEGNWEKAERSLIRHAADSGTPLVNYLTAARAAHSRGDSHLRDEYFKRAHETTPEAEIAIGLTKAELLLSDNQFEEALTSLTQLKEIAPTHASVLRMMHRVYAQLEDWDALHHLLPSLHTNKVLMETEIRLLETRTCSAQLKKLALRSDSSALKTLWSQLPGHVRNTAGVESEYFAALIRSGADSSEIETLLRKSLDKRWDETNLVLYANLFTKDGEAQLKQLDKWLKKRADDAILLRSAAIVANRFGRNIQAKDYLQRSLNSSPTVEALRLMGELSLVEGDALTAASFFRQGLLLASEEVISQIELNPEATAMFPESQDLDAETEERQSASPAQ